MSSRTTIALAAAIVLGTAIAASAATAHRRAGDADPATYNTGTIATGNAGGTITTGYCTPSGGPSCSTACLPSGPPCKPGHDTW